MNVVDLQVIGIELFYDAVKISTDSTPVQKQNTQRPITRLP